MSGMVIGLGIGFWSRWKQPVILLNTNIFDTRTLSFSSVIKAAATGSEIDNVLSVIKAAATGSEIDKALIARNILVKDGGSRRVRNTVLGW